MASTMISNSERVGESSRKKKKRSLNTKDQTQEHNKEQTAIQWKSQVQQQAYSSKLLQALRNVRQSNSPSPSKRGRDVREAADRVLASTAKGRTRWSRAILTNRLKIKFIKNRRSKVAITGSSRTKMSILQLKAKNLPAVQRKTRLLGRLVPGCRKQPLPVVLEEATDYIAALEMQVRAMSVLADMLTGPSPTSLPQ